MRVAMTAYRKKGRCAREVMFNTFSKRSACVVLLFTCGSPAENKRRRLGRPVHHSSSAVVQRTSSIRPLKKNFSFSKQ